MLAQCKERISGSFLERRKKEAHDELAQCMEECKWIADVMYPGGIPKGIEEFCRTNPEDAEQLYFGTSMAGDESGRDGAETSLVERIRAHYAKQNAMAARFLVDLFERRAAGL
jgi:hypothetical protein